MSEKAVIIINLPMHPRLLADILGALAEQVPLPFPSTNFKKPFVEERVAEDDNAIVIWTGER